MTFKNPLKWLSERLNFIDTALRLLLGNYDNRVGVSGQEAKTAFKRCATKAGGVKLDIGCGDNKQPGFVGMDYRKTPNVDILHNCEAVPYPIDKESCDIILMSHLMEHLKPWLVPSIMDEAWRILKPEGQLWLAMPYMNSFGFWQDPTHVKTWNEATPTYFDPAQFLYNIYKLKPWKIIKNEWKQGGSLEVVLQKLPLNHGIKTPGGYDSVPEAKEKK